MKLRLNSKENSPAFPTMQLEIAPFFFHNCSLFSALLQIRMKFTKYWNIVRIGIRHVVVWSSSMS